MIGEWVKGLTEQSICGSEPKKSGSISISPQYFPEPEEDDEEDLERKW
jgi:hypothetical protein